MIAFATPDRRRGRREFLRAGGLTLGGLTLPDLFVRGGSSLNATGGPVTDKAVVFLFLHGGPSQFETFDPKMDGPSEIRSVTGETKTAIPGVTFGASFPKLAARTDRFTVVRSFVPGDANHDIKPVVGKATGGANLGAAYASAAGPTRPGTGMPTNVAVFPQSVVPASQPMQAQFGNFLATGPFGSAAAPFVPGGTGPFQQNMTLTLPGDQFADRRRLREAFDGLRAGFDATGDADAVRETAFNVLLRGAGEAFDLSKEAPATVARYDTDPLIQPDAIDKKWNNKKYYVDNVATLGKLLLLSRRLVERGAGFVTVTTNFVWDMHADVNNAPVATGMGYCAPPLDHALSVFLDDLRDRGLEDKVLVVVCGEMGRTPRINKNGGRDHWGNLGPLLLAGGGLKMGQVIGRSARSGGEPADNPVGVPNLISTVMHTLFDVGKLRVTGGVSRDLLAMADAPPIPGLHG